jgi:hypothetical protein
MFDIIEAVLLISLGAIAISAIGAPKSDSKSQQKDLQYSTTLDQL